MEPFLGSQTIKTALYYPFLWGYLIFYSCIRDPPMCLISSLNTPLPIYISRPDTLTVVLLSGLWRHYSQLSSPVRYSSNNISLYPAPVCNQPNCRYVDWAQASSTIVQSWLGKEKSVCVSRSFKEGCWNYQTVLKITNLSDLARFCQHAVKYEKTRTCRCTLCPFSEGSANEKWWKSCCSGTRNRLLT